MEAAPTLSSALGRITVAREVIAQIVGQAAAESYGVVGMTPRPGVARGTIGRLLARDRLTQGIAVGGASDGLELELHVVVEYGLNLGQVAAALRSRVAYEVERLAGLPVRSIEVHIEDVRRAG